MSSKDEPVTESGDDEDGGDAKPVVRPRSRKTLIMIGAAAAVVLLGGGGGAYMMLGGKPAAAAGDGHNDKAEIAAAKDDDEGDGGEQAGANADLPLDVPPILVNLRSPDGAAHFLKVHVMLLPGKKSNLDDLRKKLPILMDAYQPFLRELRPEDLSGSAAVYRIKEELMLRAAATIGKDEVADVLVQDLVQQ